MAAIVPNGKVPGTEFEQTSGADNKNTMPIRSWSSKGQIYAEHLGAGHQKSPNPPGGNTEAKEGHTGGSGRGMKRGGY